MNPTNKLRTIVKTNTYSDLDERLAHNENIQQVPSYFKNVSLIGTKGLLVKLFKFTEHTTTKGGLITQKYKTHIKDSGKMGVNLDDFLYQARGIIVSISPEAQKFINENFEEETRKKFVPGATVWVNPSTGVSPHNQFLYDRTHPVVESIDYLVLNPTSIDGFEDATPVKEIEYVDIQLQEEPANYELSE
jgi:hypothetical protein